MLRIRRLSATRRFSATSAVKYTGGSLVVAATVFGAAAFTASRDKQLGKLWVDIVPYGAAILKHISIAEQAALDAREQTAEVIGAAREYLEHGVQKVVDAKDTVLESSQKAHKKASELLEGAQTVAKHTQEDVAGLINVSKRTVDDVLEKLSLKEKKDDGVSKISKPAARDLPTLKTDPKLPVKEAPPIEPKLQVTAQSLPKPAEIAAPIISFVEIETPTTAGKESNKVIIAEVPAQTALISDEHKTIDSSNTQAVDIKPVKSTVFLS